MCIFLDKNIDFYSMKSQWNFNADMTREIEVIIIIYIYIYIYIYTQCALDVPAIALYRHISELPISFLSIQC